MTAEAAAVEITINNIIRHSKKKLYIFLNYCFFLLCIIFVVVLNVLKIENDYFCRFLMMIFQLFIIIRF